MFTFKQYNLFQLTANPSLNLIQPYQGEDMDGFWNKVISIIIVFFLGFILKKIKLFSSGTADTLLKLSFYVTLPSLTFLSGATAELNLKFIFLPLIAILTMLLISLISAPIAGLFKMPRATHGSFFVGTLIMNTGFTLPFVIAAFGNQGLAIYTIFDFGNSLMIFTFAYYFAIKYGNNSKSKVPIKKFLLIPSNLNNEANPIPSSIPTPILKPKTVNIFPRLKTCG